MPRFLSAFVVLLAAGSSVTAPAAQPVAAPRPEGCTYDVCALRIEPGLLSRDILQGVDAVRVGRFGVIDSDLGEAVEGVEYAAEQARAYDRHHRTALLAAIAGTALVVLSAPYGPLDGSEAAQSAALIGGLGLGIVSINAQVQSERAISRAVWEYNRVLPTDAPE